MGNLKNAAAAAMLLVFGTCSPRPPPVVTRSPRAPDGVYAAWREALPAGQVIEIRGDRFRYRDVCDPDGDNALLATNPVEGRVRSDGDQLVFEGPNGWRMTRRRACVHGVDLLLREQAYQVWQHGCGLPLLGVVARVDGATFESADPNRRPRAELLIADR